MLVTATLNKRARTVESDGCELRTALILMTNTVVSMETYRFDSGIVYIVKLEVELQKLPDYMTDTGQHI